MIDLFAVLVGLLAALVLIPSESRGVLCCRLDSARHDDHGDRRDPAKGFGGGDGLAAVEASSAVTTRSPSFRSSTTSVTIPSLIPVLICLGSGRLAPDGKT